MFVIDHNELMRQGSDLAIGAVLLQKWKSLPDLELTWRDYKLMHR